MKSYRVVLDSIPHNSTEAIVKATFEEAGTTNTNPLPKKTAPSPKDDVNIEVPSSKDDSSMILVEIGVDDDESIRPILII